MKAKFRIQTAIGLVLLSAINLYMWSLPRGPEAPEVNVAGAISRSPAAVPDRDAEEDTVVAELTTKPRRAEQAPALADLVLLISVDGLRPDVVFPNAKHIHRLAVEGVSARNARTISKSSTLPSHASMVSGVDFERHGLSFNSYRPERGHIQYPTIFSAAQDAGLSTAVFVGKRKLAHLLDPDNEVHFEVGGVFCSKVVKLAEPYLRQAEPGVVFVHFSDPDGAGHTYGWMSQQYVKAVKRADRCVGQLIAALRGRGALDRTLVMLTSDHGGHDHNHGAGLISDKHIPWIMWGGPAREAVSVRRRVYNTDTAATILHALGLEPPADIEGKPVVEGLRPKG